jgi:hypothetical protein
MGRFETEILAHPSNLKVLTKLSGKWIDRLRERQLMRELILDMDSSVCERIVRHSRKSVFQMTEVAVIRELFQTILEQIGRLKMTTAMSG